MRRRRVLATITALGVTGLAGCLGDGTDGTNQEGTPGDGTDGDNESIEIEDTDYQTTTEGTDTGETDANGYEKYAIEGTEVPLAPTADAYEWYTNDAVVVADARSRSAYEEVHVTGAEWSPAPDGQESDDPLWALPTDTRILTYCACPHHLSGLRAASLVDAGYTEVYALDEGIQDWVDRGYPVEGTRVE